MSTIKNIRQQYGLTQTQMAAFLNMGLSQLAMCETNKRPFPAEASLKFTLLQQHLVNRPTKTFSKESVIIKTVQQEIFTRELLKELTKITTQINKQQVKLALLKKVYIQAVKKNEMAEMLETLPVLNNTDNALLRLLQAESERDLKKSQEGLQQLIQIKIDSLHIYHEAVLKIYESQH